MTFANKSKQNMLSALILLGVLCVALGLLYPVLQAGFLTDDYVALRVMADEFQGKEALNGGRQKALITPYFRQIHSGFQLYRPSVLASFGLNLLVSGPNPRAFLWTNLVLHLLCGALCFLLIRSLFPKGASWAAGAATLWFLISPLQIEAVAWSAARSETISLAFGLMAVLWRVRRPAARYMPAVLCALALTGKESALLFPLAIVLLDGFDPSGQRSVATDRADRLKRLLPVMVIVLAWFGLRWWIFGTPLGGSYNNQELTGYLSDPVALGGRYMRSMARVFSPISTIAYAASPMTQLLSLLFAAGTGGAVVTGLIVGLSKHRRLLVLALTFILVPLTMGVLVNEIGSALVNSRAAYTTLAGLALLAAMGTDLWPRGFARTLPLVLLLSVSAVTVKATIAPWSDTAAELQARLDSVREPLIGQDIDVVMLLGYREARYMNNAHDMSVGTRYALGRPFLKRNINLYKLGCSPDVVDPSSLRSATLGDAARVAVFGPREEAPLEFDLLYGGERRTDCGHIALGEPVADALVEVGAESPGLHFTCQITGVAKEKLFLHILTERGLLGVVPANPLAEAAGADPVTRTFTVSIPSESVLELLKGTQPFLWFVTAGPDAQTAVLASPLRRLLVEPTPR